MPEFHKILVIDDDEVVRDSCARVLGRPDQIIKTAEDGRKGLEILEKEHFDVVILDLKMPGLPGMEVLKKILEDYADSVVIVITGYPTVDSAVEAMKLGAYDFIPKPFSPESLRLVVKKAIEKRRLRVENVALKSQLQPETKPDALIGESQKVKQIRRLVEKVAPTDTTILITGESGTGKEVIARHIHNMSNRRDKMFVTVDCGALVETLFESELFGHVKGSFTGADSTKYGRFELANGGSLFLDEIANISLNIQAKLLRAIQEREVCKVGSSQVVNTDVRIIAATSRDLKYAVQKGEFRDDLFYRLCVVWMHVPPLRERKEDIPDFVQYFIKKFSKRKRKDVRHISERAMQALLKYDWPGNVRELENTIERAVVLTENDTIKPQDLFCYGLQVDANNNRGSSSFVHQNNNSTANLEEAEKNLIIRTLQQYQGHKGEAAEALGVDRKTLYRKLKKYVFTRDK
jgi:DNA-binding NtrC family response regulator